MPIEGPLRELGIHDVFQLLDLSRKTGALRVTSSVRDNEGVVLFDHGRIVSAEIRSSPTPLGEMLVRAGRIAPEELAAARQQQQAGDRRRLGELLVASGAIGARELERQVRLQIETVVFELMSWHEGFFSFEERDVSEAAREATVQVSTESLLMEGARRIDEWSRMADKLPTLEVVPVLAAVEDDHATSLDLLPSEWELLAAIDGVSDVRGIAASLGRSEFDVAKVVYGLVTTGVVAVESRSTNGRSPAETTALSDPQVVLPAARDALAANRPEDALRIARQVLGGQPSCIDARLIAAAALRRLRRLGDAAEELGRALEVAPDDPGLRLEQGIAALSRGDFNSAVASWEHCLRVTPTTAAGVEKLREAVVSAAYLRGFLEVYNGG
jgi:tetratricopeptide (TPR) repeat protein